MRKGLHLQTEALCKRVYPQRAAIGEHSAETPLCRGAWATEKGKRPQTPPTPKTTEKDRKRPQSPKKLNESGEKAEKDPRWAWDAWPEKGRWGVNSSFLSFFTQTKQLLFSEIGFRHLGFWDSGCEIRISRFGIQGAGCGVLTNPPVVNATDPPPTCAPSAGPRLGRGRSHTAGGTRKLRPNLLH